MTPLKFFKKKHFQDRDVKWNKKTSGKGNKHLFLKKIMKIRISLLGWHPVYFKGLRGPLVYYHPQHILSSGILARMMIDQWIFEGQADF